MLILSCCQVTYYRAPRVSGARFNAIGSQLLLTFDQASLASKITTQAQLAFAKSQLLIPNPQPWDPGTLNPIAPIPKQ